MKNDLISRKYLKTLIDYACSWPAETDGIAHAIYTWANKIVDECPPVNFPFYQEAYQTGYEEGQNERPKCEYTEDMKQAIKENFDIGYEMAKNKYGRKRGEWIVTAEDNDGVHRICCPFCSYEKGSNNTDPIIVVFSNFPKFCENCGAYMKGGAE